MSRDIFELRADARLLDLRNRVVIAELPTGAGMAHWSCLCGFQTFDAVAHFVAEVVCPVCGAFPMPDSVPVDVTECPSCYAAVPGPHGRGCYLDPRVLS